MEALNVVWTSLLSAAALFAIAKVMGHKQMAQMDFFDYITGKFLCKEKSICFLSHIGIK